jgi:hypothetical protein
MNMNTGEKRLTGVVFLTVAKSFHAVWNYGLLRANDP